MHDNKKLKVNHFNLIFFRGKLIVHRDLLRSVQIHCQQGTYTDVDGEGTHPMPCDRPRQRGQWGKKKNNQAREMGEDRRRGVFEGWVRDDQCKWFSSRRRGIVSSVFLPPPLLAATAGPWTIRSSWWGPKVMIVMTPINKHDGKRIRWW